MKHLARIFSLLILVSAGLFIASCGGSDPNPTSEEETQFNKLKGNWNISSVNFSTLSSPDITTEYTGMKVNFAGSFSAGGDYSYTSTPPTNSWPNPNAWKPNDGWRFKTNVLGVIIRDVDNQEMAISFSSNDTVLKIEIVGYEGNSFNSRASSVEGNWTFIFNKAP